MSTIDRLPHVCLLALFNILSTSDLVNVSLTCRTFYKILVSTKRPFTLLDFRCFERRMTYMPNKGIWSNITHVKFLSLKFCVKVSNFAPLKDMVRLISLDIYCTNISREELCEFIPMGLIGINLGYCERLTSSKLLQEFLHQRCSLEMVGLSALNQAVNDEVSTKREFWSLAFYCVRLRLPVV